MRLTVVHESCYRYDAAVQRSTQVLRLTPPELPGQHVVAWRLAADGLRDIGRDGYGNQMHLLSVEGEHQQVCVRALGTVEIEAMPVRPADELSPWLFLRATPDTEAGPGLLDLAAGFRARAFSVARLRELSAAVHARVVGGERPARRVASANQAWEAERGGSAEQAQVLIAVCRALGVPARYVSGYVFHESPGAPVSSHAWAEVWLAGAWQSMDVALQCQAGARHVRLAVGRDHADACPMRSMAQGGEEPLTHVMAMQQQQQ